MKRVVLWFVIAAAFASVARAQLVVELRASKDVYLLYESIPLNVGLRNTTGRTIELLGGDAGGWLEFIITDESGRMVAKHGRVQTDANVLVPAGQTLSRNVDVLPLYSLRQRGTYRAQVRIRQGDLHVLSTPVTFAIVQGRELWKQTVPVPMPGKGDEYRTYSLLAHRTKKEDLLYVCVQDEPKDLIYGLVSLGAILPLSEPDVRIDKRASLHLLYQGAPNAFGYAQIDPFGQTVNRATYSDKLSRPRLVADGESVAVAGGLQTYPRPERVLTEVEMNPPPPPPPPPKKKWWWPFRPRPKVEEDR